MLIKDYTKNDTLRDRAHRCAAVLAKWSERGIDRELLPALCGELMCVSRLIQDEALGEEHEEDTADLYSSALKKALSR